jgi:hypothetical protein
MAAPSTAMTHGRQRYMRQTDRHQAAKRPAPFPVSVKTLWLPAHNVMAVLGATLPKRAKLVAGPRRQTKTQTGTTPRCTATEGLNSAAGNG